MIFFQMFMMVVAVIAATGTVAETKGKGWYLALFAVACILYLAARIL